MGAVKRNTLSVLFIIKKAKLLKNGDAHTDRSFTDFQKFRFLDDEQYA